VKSRNFFKLAAVAISVAAMLASSTVAAFAASAYVSGKPTFSSTPAVGALQHPSDYATWQTDTVLTYEWFSNGVSVATSADYTPTVSDAGHSLVLTVTGTLNGYDTASISSDPATVALGTTHFVGMCLLGYPLGVGFWPHVTVSLTCPAYPVANASKVVHWRLDAVDVATGDSYEIQPADLGKQLSARVVASAPGYNDFSYLTLSMPVVKGNQQIKGSPAISGGKHVGDTVTAVEGTWAAGETFSYTWKQNNQIVARTRTYLLTDVGNTLMVTVCGHQTGSYDFCADTPAYQVLPGTIRIAPKPRFYGPPVVGTLFQVDAGIWQVGTTLKYQWLIDGKPVKGATKVGFVVPKSAKGHALAVTVTGVKAKFTSVSRTSSATKIKY